MPLFLRMSPITAVRFAAILAAASRRAAATSSLSGAAALTDRPKIFLERTNRSLGSGLGCQGYAQNTLSTCSVQEDSAAGPVGPLRVRSGRPGSTVKVARQNTDKPMHGAVLTTSR